MIFGNSLLCRLCVIIFLSPVVYSQALDNNGANSSYLRNDLTFIFNGSVARPAQFPFQASLRHMNVDQNKTDRHYCGGVILNSLWVVTSGSCIRYYQSPKWKSRMRIVAGVMRLIPSDLEYNVRRAAQLIVHPSYKKETNWDHKFNIGLILINKKWKFNKPWVKPIKPINYSLPAYKTKCTVSGWGQEYPNSPDNAPTLLYAEQYLYDHDFCNHLLRHYEFKFTRETICAGNVENFTGFCIGDMGGPLVCDNHLTGVASNPLTCGQGGLRISGYMNITYYWPWVEAVMIEWSPKKYKLNNGQKTLHGSLDSFRIVNLLFLLCIIIIQVY